MRSRQINTRSQTMRAIFEREVPVQRKFKAKLLRLLLGLLYKYTLEYA